MSLALDAAELLFNCLANVSGGDWTQQSLDWQQAAHNARASYHRALNADPRGQPVGARLSDQRILAVLRSDYELVLRLAADRLRSLDEAYPPESPNVTVPGPHSITGPEQVQHRDCDEAEREIRVLEEQLADAERVAAKLARECDQLRADRKHLEYVSLTWQERAEKAERQLTKVRETVGQRIMDVLRTD